MIPSNFPKPIRCVQLNAQHSRSPTDQLIAASSSWDLAFLQEPYKWGVNLGFPASFTTFHNTPINAAIILSPSLDAGLRNYTRVLYSTEFFITISLGPLTLSSGYRPPHADNLYHFITDFPLYPRHIICADINCHNTLWSSPTTSFAGNELASFFLQNDLTLLNGGQDPPSFHTSNGSSNIDITVCSNLLHPQISNWHINPDSDILSDHSPIYFTFANPSSDPPATSPPKLNHRALDRVSFINHLVTNAPPPISTDTPASIKLFIDALQTAVYACTPLFRPFKHKCSWWSSYLDTLKLNLRQARRYQRIHPSTANLDRTKSCASVYRSAITFAKKKAWRSFLADCKSPWDHVYKIAKKSGSSTFEKAARQTAFGSIPETEAALIKHFFHHTPGTNVTPDYIQPHPPPPTDNLHISDLIARVHKLAPFKSSGLDHILPLHFQLLPAPWMSNLFDLLNNCYRQLLFPNSLKIGKVIFLLKPGKLLPPDGIRPLNHFRPIVLLPIFGKLYEYLLLKKLRFHIPPHPSQFAFIKGRSTEAACLTLRGSIKKAFHEKSRLSALSTDFSSAFDTIEHQFILRCLSNLNTPPHLITLISDYLRNRIVTSSANCTSLCSRGVPQGSVLSPFLWNIAVGELLTSLNSIPDCTALGFADDLLPFTVSSSNISGLRTLGLALDTILTWCLLSGVSLNLTKCSVVHFTRRLNLPDFVLPGIATKPTLKWLGILFDRRLNWHEHLSARLTKASSITHWFVRTSRVNYGIPARSLALIYNAVLIPIIFYNVTVWHDVSPSFLKRTYAPITRGLKLRICKGLSTVSHNICNLLTCSLSPVDTLRWLVTKRLNSSRAHLYATVIHHADLSASNWLARPLDTNFKRTCHIDYFLNCSDIFRAWFTDINALYTANRGLALCTKSTTAILSGHIALNHYLHRFGKSDSPSCRFCMVAPETVLHVCLCPCSPPVLPDGDLSSRSKTIKHLSERHLL